MKAKGKKWVQERPYLFKYFPISKFKDYNWAICNTNWLTHISAWMRGAFLFCSVSEFNFYTLVFTAVLWISRLFQSLAVRERDWPVNLAPSQWDLTQMSLCIDHLSPPLTLFSGSSLLSSTINGLLSHCSQSPVNMFSPCPIPPTSNSHLFFTLADFVLPLFSHLQRALHLHTALLTSATVSTSPPCGPESRWFRDGVSL